MGTHLNCIDKSMQFKWITTTYAFIKKYTGCYLKTTELLDCAVTGVSAIIRSNTVFNLRPYDIIKSSLNIQNGRAHKSSIGIFKSQ